MLTREQLYNTLPRLQKKIIWRKTTGWLGRDWLNSPPDAWQPTKPRVRYKLTKQPHWERGPKGFGWRLTWVYQ